MKYSLLLLLGLLFILTSCGQADPNKQVDEGKVENNFYTSEEIGWTMEIPKGWTVVDKEKKDALNQKGLKALEETLDSKVDFSALRNLISFQKNPFNIFQSTSEPFNLEYEGEWEENNAALKEVLYETYVNQGIKVDSSATTIEKIDGIEFQVTSFTVYSPKGDIILTQIMYSCLINGFDFGVNINYNNKKDREEMLRVFMNSTFK